jgi:hypothetical protein
MGRYYILRDGRVFEESDHSAWLDWVENRYPEVSCVAQTKTASATVETRFLAVNLTLAENDAPLLFETRVAGGWLDGRREKFATPEAARAGHLTWVDRVRAVEDEDGLPPPGAGW